MSRKNAITNEVAAKIKAMKDRGDKNQDIAAWFGINQGRISDVCGINCKPQYQNIAAEINDIPPPGPYEFGGGGISQVYRVVIEMRRLWDSGDVGLARVKFDSLYHSLGRSSELNSLDDIVAILLYDDRGVPKQ